MGRFYEKMRGEGWRGMRRGETWGPGARGNTQNATPQDDPYRSPNRKSTEQLQQEIPQPYKKKKASTESKETKSEKKDIAPANEEITPSPVSDDGRDTGLKPEKMHRRDSYR